MAESEAVTQDVAAAARAAAAKAAAPWGNATDVFTLHVEALIELRELVDTELSEIDGPRNVFSGLQDLIKDYGPDQAEVLRGAAEQMGEAIRNLSDGSPGQPLTIDKNPMVVFMEELTKNAAGERWVIDLLEALNAGMKRPSRREILYRSILISLFAGFEELFASVARLTLTTHPASIGGDGVLSLSDIIELGSIQDAVDLVIDRKVDALLFKSFEDWMKWCETAFSATPKDYAIDWDRLIEVIQRRHVIIHSGGRASRQYLERVPAAFREVEAGAALPIDSDYVQGAIDELFVFGIRLVVRAWTKLCPAGAKFAFQDLRRRVYSMLLEERWVAAKALAESSMKFDPDERPRLVSKVNWFLARKMLEGPEAIRAEVTAWNVTSLAPRFQLAKAALLGDVDSALALVAAVVAVEPLSKAELAEWPLLAEVRLDTRFIEEVSRPVSPSTQGSPQAPAKKAPAKKAPAKKAPASGS